MISSADFPAFFFQNNIAIDISEILKSIAYTKTVIRTQSFIVKS